MRAGTLDTSATIQRRSGGTNDWGEPLPDGWEDVATVWANVLHKSGGQAIRADAEVSTVRASIRIRHRADVDAGMRVLVESRIYDIEAVLPGAQRRVYLDLVCKQVT